MVKENAAVNFQLHQSKINNNLKDVQKDYGIFFTPERIVDFMVGLIDKNRYANKNSIYILEPACGLAQFLIGIKRNFPSLFNKADLFGVEVNQDIINYLTNLNIIEHIKLTRDDYLLWQPNVVFDLIIGNPPYGIPSLSDHYAIKIDSVTKDKYKKMYETWYGKYNVYGAFIEKSIKLLQPGGQLIFVVPATFLILDEFKKLRKFLAKNGTSEIIYLGPDVFKPEADVALAVLVFYKSNKSTGVKLMEYWNNNICLIKENLNWQGEVVKFETKYTRTLEKNCSYLLQDIYEVKISPRTPEIKNNSGVMSEEPSNSANYLPILNGRNLKCNRIIYDNITGYWIKKSSAKKLRGYFGIPHIVIGLGFRENGKVAAAYDEENYLWMGDIYHLIRKGGLFSGGFDLNEAEILEYLNSDYLRKYVKEVYREITYHLSITQLNNFPLPTRKEWQRIKSRRIL